MTKFIEIPAGKTSLTKRKAVLGIGINDADYLVQPKINGKQKKCPFYRAWHDMLKRCYSKKLHLRRPTYIGCRVDDSWLKFSNFKEWMQSQDWEGKDLDKDIKIIGCKVYSHANCLFVTKKINNLLNTHAAGRGKWPLGVYFHKTTNKFAATCHRNGRQEHLGLFATPNKASNAYKAYKKKTIEDIASLPENEYIREYLLNHAALLITNKE